MSRAYRYASSPLSLHQAGALASPPGHRDRMNLAPPYDVLATRFVPLHDPNPDVTPTPPPAIFKDQLAVIRSFDRGTPRYRGFRCSCPPTPGRTHSLTDKLYPDAPSWQPFVLLGGLAAGVWLRGVRGCHAPSRGLGICPAQLVPIPSPCGDPSPRPGFIESPRVTHRTHPADVPQGSRPIYARAVLDRYPSIQGWSADPIWFFVTV